MTALRLAHAYSGRRVQSDTARDLMARACQEAPLHLPEVIAAPRTKQLGIVLSNAQAKMLREAAKKNGVSVNALVDAALHSGLNLTGQPAPAH